MRRSNELEDEAIIEKWSKWRDEPQVSEWFLIDEWIGLVRREPVRKLLPMCSETLVLRERQDDFYLFYNRI